MHILHVTPYYAPAYSFGGVVSMLEGLTQAQVAQEHQVTVLTTDAFSIEERYHGDLETVQNGVRVIRSRNWVYSLRRYNLDTPFGMTSHAQKLMPEVDIVHLHEFRTVENLLVTLVAAQHDVPVVLSPHGTLTYSTGRSTLKSVWDGWLSPRIVPAIRHVIALADSEVADARLAWEQFSVKVPVSVIPNGVNLADYSDLPDSTAFRQKYSLGDSRVILFMGRLHQRKGVDVLARAFARANVPDTKLLLVGPDEGMLETIEKINHPDIVLTGFLRGDDRLAALASADIFVLPAIGEGLSMAVLEAMASGVPVLLSEGCNLPEAATANAGKLILIDENAIAQTLSELLEQPATLKVMGNNARQLIAEQFTWDRIATQMSDLYKNLRTP